MMIVELIIPIEALRGALRQDGFYFRKYKGRQLLQRCPNRKGHVKTEAEARNQERFAEQYGNRSRPPRGKWKMDNGQRKMNLGPNVPSTEQNGKDQEDRTGEAAGGASGAG